MKTAPTDEDSTNLAQQYGMEISVDKYDEGYESDDGSLAARDSLALAPSTGDDISKDPVKQRKAREKKYIIGAITIFLVILSVILAVTLSGGKNDKKAEIHQDDIFDRSESGQVGTPTASPTESPTVKTLSPTSSPTVYTTSSLQLSLAYQTLKDVVPEPPLLLDSETPQGQAFLTVLGEDDPFYIVQRFALMTVYFGTGGQDWNLNFGWSDYANGGIVEPNDECNWPGVSLCRYQGVQQLAVAKFNLASNNLSGEWPAEACLLNQMEDMELSGNVMEGQVPQCLVDLAELTDLQLPSGDLVGVSDLCDKEWETLIADCSVDCECCTACLEV